MCFTIMYVMYFPQHLNSLFNRPFSPDKVFVFLTFNKPNTLLEITPLKSHSDNIARPYVIKKKKKNEYQPPSQNVLHSYKRKQRRILSLLYIHIVKTTKYSPTASSIVFRRHTVLCKKTWTACFCFFFSLYTTHLKVTRSLYLTIDMLNLMKQ